MNQQFEDFEEAILKHANLVYEITLYEETYGIREIRKSMTSLSKAWQTLKQHNLDEKN